MVKKSILRVSHKFLIDSDGYDFHLQDLCKSTYDQYQNYIITYINCSLIKYVKTNNLKKKGKLYYHSETKTYILPITYKRKYNNYLKDLYLKQNIIKFQKAFELFYDEIKPSIVHIHGTLIPQFLHVAKYSKKSKVFATHHIGLINQNYHKQKISILWKKFWIHNKMPNYCDKIICVSNHGRKSFLNRKKNIIVVNPIPNLPKQSKVKLNKIISKNKLHNKFKIFKKDKLFYVVGRICPQKNQLKIVSAFNQIIKFNPEHKLILVGNVKNKEYFEKLMKEIEKNKDNYCLIPTIRKEEIMTIIDNSVAIISSTHNEGFGRAAIEALMMGKGVIGSKGAGNEDFIDHEKNGLLIDPNRINSIKKAILNIDKLKSNKKYSHVNYIKKIKKIYGGKK